MPNFRLPNDLKHHIQNQAVIRANRVLDYAMMDFPLTTAQVQYHCVGLNETEVTQLRAFRDAGKADLHMHQDIRLTFNRASIPGLRRSVAFNLRMPEPIVVTRGTMYGVPTIRFDVEDGHYLLPRVGELDAFDRERLVHYLNETVRQKRLFEIATNTVAAIMNMCATTSHLVAAWPLLTTLIDESYAKTWNSTRKNYDDWRERFRNPVNARRLLKAYRLSDEMEERWRKYIEVSEMQIVAGDMLENPERDFKKIHPTIELWERREGDVEFPL